MADSLLLSFSSNGSSRPPSRAHSHASDATERPDTASSTRALTKEVDHIKHLIKRSQDVSTQPQSITAQIFRQRSASTPVTLEHICHELDQLKKRIREEQYQHQPQVQPPQRRASDIDPDASESEAEVDDVLDEREEELERAREEIHIVKQHGEQLLEAAESRVDRLTSEKESLEGTLRGYKDELATLLMSLQDHKSHLNQLHEDNKTKTASYNDAQQQISTLHHLKAEARTSLKFSSARVSCLEEESRKAAEQVMRLASQHETREKELTQEIRTLNGKSNKISAETEEFRISSRTLQGKLDKAEAQSARAKKEHDARCDVLSGQVDEHKRLLQKATQRTGQHTKELELLRADHEQRQARFDALEKQLKESQEKLSAALHEQEQVAKAHQQQIENAKQEHEEALRQMQAAREAELKQVQQKQDEARSSYVEELEVLKAAKAKELDGVKAQWRSSLEKLRASHQTELEAAKSKLTDEVSSLKTAHITELKNVKIANSGQVKELTATLTEVKARVTATEAEHKADIQRAADEASRKADAAQYRFLEQLAEHESAAEARLTSLRKDHTQELAKSQAELAVLVEAAQNEVKLSEVELVEVRQTHDAALKQLHADHVDHFGSLRKQHDEAYANLQSQHEHDIQSLHKEQETKTMEAAAAAAVEHETALAQRQFEHIAMLQQVRSDHEAQLSDIESKSRSESAALHKEVEEAMAQVNDLRSEHARQLEEHTSAHAAELGAVRSLLDQQGSEHATRAADAEQKLASIGADHANELARLTRDHGKLLTELRDAHRTAESRFQQEHQAALSTLKDEHTRLVETASAAHQAELGEHNMKHDAAVVELVAKHDQQVLELREVDQNKAQGHEKELQQIRESAATELDRVCQEHQETIQTLRQANEATDAEHATIKQRHQEALQDLKQQSEADLEKSRSLRQTEAAELRSSLETQVEEARIKHEQALADQNAVWNTQMDALTEQHSRSIRELAQGSDNATAFKLKQLQANHEEAAMKAVGEAHADATEKAHLAEQQHTAALGFAVDRARHSGQAEVKNLKKRHQDAVAQIRKMARQQAAAQLTNLEKSHQEKHEADLLRVRIAAERDLQTAIESHQSELLHLSTEHQTTLGALQTRLDMQRLSEIATKEDSHQHEVEALQARLDVTLTGQAEAERSLARLRQQVSQAEQRVAEAKLSSENDITMLQKEKADLTTQLCQAQNSLRDLQSKFSNGTTTPKTKDAHEELATIKSKLSALEEDRATSRLDLQKRLDEKIDLIRQNDFLVQELETLYAQRLRPQYTARKTRNALIQTEDFVSEEPKVDLISFQEIKAGRRKSARPVTPMSPGQRQAKDEIDMAWKTRSFEDYLQNAKTELSELGSVITANETLFAQKIQEHVGELQRVKDELAADYKSKLDDLAGDKEQMEQMVTSKQTAAFAKDRQQLVASYGADRVDPSEQIAVLTSLPVNDAVALRIAEVRLVQDYNKRIAKRKSRIALRHAEEYHALTEEYDKKVAQLLDNQNSLEGDLSVDPWKFERDLGDLRTQSANLETGEDRNVAEIPLAMRSQRGRAIQQGAPSENGAAPQSTGHIAPDRPKTALSSERPQIERWTSHPRTSTSIPRSSSVPRGSYQERLESPEPPAVPKVLFPGGRDSPHATSQPYQGPGRYPPVTERSLLRTKNPTDVQEQRRVFTEPSPRKTPTKRGSEKAAQTLGITPTEVEREAAQTERGTQSIESPTRPGFFRKVRDRLSIDGHRPHFHRPGSRNGRPGSRNGLCTTPEPEASSSSLGQAPVPAVTRGPSFKNRRLRSTKLSSGMIYYQNPKQGPTKGYE